MDEDDSARVHALCRHRPETLRDLNQPSLRHDAGRDSSPACSGPIDARKAPAIFDMPTKTLPPGDLFQHGAAPHKDWNPRRRITPARSPKETAPRHGCDLRLDGGLDQQSFLLPSR